MDLLHLDAWTTLAWLVAAAWIAIIVIFVSACRNWTALRPTEDRLELSDGPRLSVIVAARNETDCIEICLRSLLRQDYPDFEVIAVDDRSSDGTGKILDRLALEFASRLRVVHVSALPLGWFGKPYALTRGLEIATGELVCFTDADCEYESAAALRTTVAEMNRRGLDFF